MCVSSILHNIGTKDPRAAKLAISSNDLTDEEIFKLRYQNGPNLGGLFVQERWIDSSLFNPNAEGSSELAALQSWGKSPNMRDLQKRWEKHWGEFVTEEDFANMALKCVTCVRLPIGFFSLGKSNLMRGTPFYEYAEVYMNSWNYVENIINAAERQNIGVIVDLHAVPGGANGDEHSGTSSGRAELWKHSRFRDLAMSVYEELTIKTKGLKNVVALQLVNEVPLGESKAFRFYLDAAALIRSINSTVPILISDGWDCRALCEKVKKWNESVRRDSDVNTTGFVVDTHVYRTFSEDDKGKSAEEHIQNAPSSVQPHEDVDIIVGEWSCCLDERSWAQSRCDRDAMEVEFGKAQLQCFRELAGNFFWTYKFGQGNGGSWDWRVMSDRGVLLPKVQSGRGDCERALQDALNGHRSYWDRVDCRTDWEHWRFEAGFRDGWNDAERFSRFNGSRPGFVAQLKTARLRQHTSERGSSDKNWVYGQAYVQGIRARLQA